MKGLQLQAVLFLRILLFAGTIGGCTRHTAVSSTAPNPSPLSALTGTPTQIEQRVAPKLDGGSQYVLAQVFDATGRPEQAFKTYIRVVDSARHSSSLFWEGTAAALSLVTIRDRVKNFEHRIRPYLEKWSVDPGELSMEAIFQLRTLLFSFALKNGDDKNATQLLHQTGCIAHWEMAGPVSDSELGKETLNRLLSQPIWPATVNTGFGNREAKIAQIDASVCQIAPAQSDNGARGTIVARATISTEKTERVWFRLQTSSDATIWINNTNVYQQSTREHWVENTRWFSVNLSKGTHQISAEVYSPLYAPSFSLSAVLADKSPVAVGTQNLPLFTGLSLTDREAESTAPAQTDSALWAKLKVDSWNIDPESWLRDAARLPPDEPFTLLFRAEYELMSPFNAVEVGMENARQLYSAALQRSADLVDAAIFLAKWESRNDQVEEALHILNKAILAAKTEPALQLAKTEVFFDQSWLHEANQSLSDAQKLVGENCDIRHWRYALALSQKQYADAARWARRIAQCAASSSIPSRELTRGGAFDKAASSLSAIAHRQPDNAAAAMEAAMAHIYAGQLNKGVALLESTVQTFPNLAAPRATLADVYLAAGKTDAANALCTTMSDIPTDPVLYASCEAIRGRGAIDELRIDGIAVVASYLKKHTATDADFSWLLDRMVFLIDDFGAGVKITHWIGQINSKEALDEYGELDVAPNGRVLQARVIKSDLSILYPTVVENKSTLSLPNLEVGDFIEFENIVPVYLHPIYEGGFDTEPFYFQDFSSAFIRSELVVVAPTAFPLQFDSRADAPDISKKTVGDMQIVTARARNAAPLTEEPDAPSAKEFLPSVRVTAHATQAALCRHFSASLHGMSQFDPVLNDFIQTHILKSHQPATTRETANHLYTWVMNHIENDSLLFEPASHIFSRRRGSRVRLLQSMLQHQGIPAQIGLALPVYEDQTIADIPNAEQFSVPVLRLSDGTWVFMDEDRAPMGFLPSAIRYQPVRLLQSCETMKMDGGITPFDNEIINADLQIDKNGNASGTIIQSITGEYAAVFRSAFQGPEGEHRQLVEEHLLAPFFPEAVLNTFSLRNIDDVDSPLVIEYNVSIPQLFENGDLPQSISLPMRIDATGFTGGLANRRTPLVLATHLKSHRTIRISLPHGRLFQSVPNDGCAKTDAKQKSATYCTSFAQQNGVLTAVIDMYIDAARIPPQEYSDFHQFVLQTEQLNSVVIGVK